MKAEFDPVASSRSILRLAATGGLATLAPDGRPFVTFVTCAATMPGEPVLLISKLALHTQNIERDPRVSLLLVAPGGEGGDPLAGARLTVVGTAVKEDAPESRSRFLARHPEAAGYAGFPDFAIYRIAVDHGHLVAGFGRIERVEPRDLLLDLGEAAPLAQSEAGAVDHMNEDHRDAIGLYATKLAGAPAADWRMSDFDPEGMTLISAAGTIRVPFSPPLAAAGDLRPRLVEMAKSAREAA